MSAAGSLIPAVCLVVVMGICPCATAQAWSFDAYAGRENYTAVPAAVASTTGVLGIRFDKDYRNFQAALGLPLASETVTWGVFTFGDRFAFRRGGFTAGADVSLLAHVQRDPVTSSSGSGLQAEVFPMVAHSFSRVTLEAKSGPRWYGSRLGGVDWERKLWTTEFSGGVRVGEEVHVKGDLRHDHGPDSEDYARIGASVSTILGRTIVQAGVGHWVAGLADVRPEWNASVTLPVAARVWIFSSIERESFHPLFLNSSRTSWSAGVTYRLSGDPARGNPDSVRIGQGNRVLIRVPESAVDGLLSIAGDFTNWKPVPMTLEGREWRFEIPLAAGVYRYAFRTEDDKWIVPESIPNRTDDGMGGSVAVLVVP